MKIKIECSIINDVIHFVELGGNNFRKGRYFKMLLMSDITRITVIFGSILAILLIILVIVTVKVLKSKPDAEDYDEEKWEKDNSDGDGYYDEDDNYEDDDDSFTEDSDYISNDAEQDNEVDSDESEEIEEVEEPVKEQKVNKQNSKKKETKKAAEKKPSKSKVIIPSAVDEVGEEDEVDEPTDDISEVQFAAKKLDPEYEEATVVMDEVIDEVSRTDDGIDSEFADSAFAPESVANKLAAKVAVQDKKKKDLYEAKKAAKKLEDTRDMTDVSSEVPTGDTVELTPQDEEYIDDDSANEDSAFEDSAFEDSAFEDSAFGDSAFGAQPEYEEEKIRPLPETSNTIPINPVNTVNIATVNSVDLVNTTNLPAGISDMNEVKDFLEENPTPKKKKKKVKKRDEEFIKKFGDLEPEFGGGKFYWYNTQDIENLTKKEDMYFYCHYFNSVEEAAIPLITEMYDCAFVKTEEIQYIAYGVKFKSMNFREIINTQEHIDFDRDEATKEPTEEDMDIIYEKWRGYVDKFLEIIVIEASQNVKDAIVETIYEYGRNDVDVLMVSPE